MVSGAVNVVSFVKTETYVILHLKRVLKNINNIEFRKSEIEYQIEKVKKEKKNSKKK